MRSLRASGLWLVAAIATALLALPVMVLLGRAGVEGSLGLTVTSRVVIDALALSLVTSGVSVVVTVCIGTPLAYLLARRRFTSQAEARMAVFSYIEGWYNPARRHSGIRYLSPIAYETQMLKEAQTT